MSKPPPTQDAEDYIRQGCTVTYVAVDGVFSGFLALSDTLRKESAATIKALSHLGVQPVLLTGDHENAAKTISEKLHIREVRANCLPEDKLKYIGEYQVKAMPHLVALSKRMMTTIKLNMTFSMTLTFIAIVLAISGTLNPMVGALVHNAGFSVSCFSSFFDTRSRSTALPRQAYTSSQIPTHRVPHSRCRPDIPEAPCSRNRDCGQPHGAFPQPADPPAPSA